MENKILTIIKQICLDFAIESINHTLTIEKINSEYKKLSERSSFIPINYSVFSNLIQSMAIQQGSLIEDILHCALREENMYTISEYSGQKKVKLYYTANSQNLIDNYMKQCKTNSKNKNFKVTVPIGFDTLLNQIIVNENSDLPKITSIEQDIDILFKNGSKYNYYEVKTNDNHDSSKFTAINRKVLETYAGLVNLLNIKSIDELNIGIYYFNSKARKNPYLPIENIEYLHTFFERYIHSIKYSETKEILDGISKNKIVIDKLDRLYKYLIKNEQSLFN